MSVREVPAQTTSEARIVANRQNAQRSTGPATAEGKARSSQNAITHGVFSKSGHPIISGLFAEDPAETQAYVEGIVTGLAPRDAVERAQAHVAANVFLRDTRLGRFEAVALSSAGTVPVGERNRLAQEIRETQEHWDGCEYLRRALTGMEDDPDCEKLVQFIQKRQIAARDAVARLWRDGLPDTPEDWCDAFKALLVEVWGPEDAAAIEWVEGEMAAARHSLGVLEGRALAGAADRSLQTFDRVTVYGTRISLVLERAMREYRQLQARPLTPPADPPRPLNAPKRVPSVAEITARETNPTLEDSPAT